MCAARSAGMTVTGGTGDSPLRGWRSQLIFFLSGSIFVFNQQESYWGANDPRSMLNGVSQYAGMSVFALVWERSHAPTQPAPRTPRSCAALTVAIPDACDTFFMVYDIAPRGRRRLHHRVRVRHRVTACSANASSAAASWAPVGRATPHRGRAVVVAGTGAGGARGSLPAGRDAHRRTVRRDHVRLHGEGAHGRGPATPVQLNGTSAPADGGDDPRRACGVEAARCAGGAPPRKARRGARRGRAHVLGAQSSARHAGVRRVHALSGGRG